MLLLEGYCLTLPSVAEVPSAYVVTDGITLICLRLIIGATRPDESTANSRNRCSSEYKRLIVVRIDLPLATDPVSPNPSRLANLRHCLIPLLS